MSIQCPAGCGRKIPFGVGECECGWRTSRRGAVQVNTPRDEPEQRPRAPHTGRFHSPEELAEHELQQHDIEMNMRRRLNDRRKELENVPRHRRWAKEILIRVEENDPRVTPTMHAMAKEALGLSSESHAEAAA